MHEEAKIKGSNGQEWKVIETFDADDTKVKNGLQAIAVVPANKYKPGKNSMTM